MEMLRVVIVEDEEPVRRSLLEQVDWIGCGCTVVGQAADGVEGLRLIRQTAPGLVVTDIYMPRLDGLGMLRLLRQEGFAGEAAILTAHSQFSCAQEAVRLRCAEYLLKPLQPRLLEQAVTRIRTHLLRQAPRTALLPELPPDIGPYSTAAAAYIAAHYGEELTVADIARYAQLSEGHLSHVFKQETGRTVIGYLTEYRMFMAKELLTDSRSRISEVAKKVGYQNLSNFSLAFKKYTGMPAMDYKKHREKKSREV